MDFCNVIRDIEKKRQELTKLLVSFVLTDSILYISNELKKGECYNNIVRVISLVNNFLDTSYQISDGIDVLDINKEQSEKLEKYLESISIEKFCVIYIIATEVRSVFLGVLFVEQKIDTEEVFDLAFFEELYEQNKWGIVEDIRVKHDIIKSRIIKIKEFCVERGLYKNRGTSSGCRI